MMRSGDVAKPIALRPRRLDHDGRRRRGSSLVETVLAAFLATILGLLLAMSCATFGRPALEVDARARITQEGILAAQSIACDLGGFLADSSGRKGTCMQNSTLNQYSFTGWDLSQGDLLVLNFQGATPSEPIVITYQQSGNQLVRYSSSSDITTTIASYVTAFSVSPNPDNLSQALIQITIAFRYFSATYTLVGVSPL
jgi:hypothetical protein